jgi:hypothetical protein
LGISEEQSIAEQAQRFGIHFSRGKEEVARNASLAFVNNHSVAFLVSVAED